MKTKLHNEKTRYLLGLSGQNILYALVSSCFAYYLQFTILIPAFWLGIILSSAKIFDAVKDPFIGAFINKSKWPLANYLWYLPLPTAVITVLCFTMNAAGSVLHISWVSQKTTLFSIYKMYRP